jgi:hypothetical protein
MKEGVTTTMKRRKGRGWLHPSWAAAPFSYIYMLDMLLFISNTLSLSIPYLVAPPWFFLKRSDVEIVSHQHLEKCRRRRSSSGSYFCCPAGPRDVTEPYV